MAPSMPRPEAGSNLIGGVDAGRRGKAPAWILAVSEAQAGASAVFSSYLSFSGLWDDAKARGLLVLAVDMPLGLPSATQGWRVCEDRARGRLGRKRAEAVFQSPPLCALNAVNHEDASRLAVEAGGNELSGDTYRLLEKCRDAREVLMREPAAFDAYPPPRVAEVHAEVCFWELNGKKPTRDKKRDNAGQEERLTLLRRHFSRIDAEVTAACEDLKLSSYDLLDAAAAAWTARRIASGAAECLGDDDRDEDGFPMLIWV